MMSPMPPHTVLLLERRLEERSLPVPSFIDELVVELAEGDRRPDGGDDRLLAGLDVDVLDERDLEPVARHHRAVAGDDREVVRAGRDLAGG